LKLDAVHSHNTVLKIDTWLHITCAQAHQVRLAEHATIMKIISAFHPVNMKLQMKSSKNTDLSVKRPKTNILPVTKKSILVTADYCNNYCNNSMKRPLHPKNMHQNSALQHFTKYI